MKIDANDVLWSSRGEDWGFRILRHPRSHCDWLEVHEAVFANSKDDERFYTRAQIGAGQTDREKCVGLRFLDPESRRDSAGRVIPHEFIVFGQSSSAFDNHADWARALWQIVSEEYATLYPMNAKEVQERINALKSETARTTGASHSGNESIRDSHGKSQATDWRLMLLLIATSLSTGYLASFLVSRVPTKPIPPRPSRSAAIVTDFVPNSELRDRINVLRANGGMFPGVNKRASEIVKSVLEGHPDFLEVDVAAAFISEYTSTDTANGPNH